MEVAAARPAAANEGSIRSVESVEILGARLNRVTSRELDEWLDAALFGTWDGRCRHIVTLNPEYVMSARRNPGFATAINDADLSIADGVGVVIAARLLYRWSATRITGVELVERLAGVGAPMFFLGAGPGVAELAASRLRERVANTNIAGVWCAGTPEHVLDEPTLERIAETHAHVVAVAYGAPDQVLWIQRNQRALAGVGVRLVIGVGGAFDYLSGTARRPPAFLRGLGMEWLFRLMREPRRWRRQLVLPYFAILVLEETFKARIRSVKKTTR